VQVVINPRTLRPQLTTEFFTWPRSRSVLRWAWRSSLVALCQFDGGCRKPIGGDRDLSAVCGSRTPETLSATDGRPGEKRRVRCLRGKTRICGRAAAAAKRLFDLDVHGEEGDHLSPAEVMP